MSLRKNYLAVHKLFEAFHELRSNRKPPDSRMVAGILFCLTNEHLIDLLRFLLENPHAKSESLALSRRSSLFDKLILVKGSGDKPWVLRLHTYQVPRGSADGVRVSNLGEELRDDEANTHFHRWQLGSRFLSGGFNNVTWDVSDSGGEERHRQTRFGIPATSRAGSSGLRKAEELGNAWVTERRSDFYMDGDVIAYPIVDAHSVSASMAPYVGTTMTFAHTGREELDDSSFFKVPSETELDSVRQEKFTDEEHTEATLRAITRLQLVELNKSLANRRRNGEAFRHMNSFETELLPRIAELLVLSSTDTKRWDWSEWVRRAGTVDLDEAALRKITQMDSGSVAWLIIASQKHLFDKSFVSDVTALSRHHREFSALTNRLGTGSVPLNARRF